MELFVGLCIIFCFLGVWTVSKKRFSRNDAVKLFIVAAFVCFLIISGCRALDIGADTPMYVRYFGRLEGIQSLDVQSWRFEFGYRLMCCLIAQFCRDPHALLFVSALLTLGLFFRVFCRESEVPVYSVLMFLGLTFFYNSMCISRQYIAMAICCHAILFLVRKKRIPFVVLTVIAGLVHTTGFLVLFLLVFSLLPYRKEKRYWYVLIGLGFAVSYNLIANVLVRILPVYTNYFYSESYYLQGKLGSVIKAVIYAVFFVLYDRIYAKYGDNSERNKIQYFVGLLGTVITIVSIQGAILSRVAAYFYVYYCVSLPNAFSWIPNRRNKYIIASIVLAGCFAYNIAILAFRPYWSGILPYAFWE